MLIALTLQNNLPMSKYKQQGVIWTEKTFLCTLHLVKSTEQAEHSFSSLVTDSQLDLGLDFNWAILAILLPSLSLGSLSCWKENLCPSFQNFSCFPVCAFSMWKNAVQIWSYFTRNIRLSYMACSKLKTGLLFSPLP